MTPRTYEISCPEITLEIWVLQKRVYLYSGPTAWYLCCLEGRICSVRLLQSDYVTLCGTRNKQTSKTALWMQEQLKALADTLKKQGERIWKRHKQHISPSTVCQKNWIIVKGEVSFWQSFNCEEVDVFHKFSLNLDRWNYTVKEPCFSCKSVTPGWLAPGWTPQGWTSCFALSQDPRPTEIS